MMASIGVALKIITNLFMLPIVASYCRFGPAYVARITRARVNAARGDALAGADCAAPGKRNYAGDLRGDFRHIGCGHPRPSCG